VAFLLRSSASSYDSISTNDSINGLQQDCVREEDSYGMRWKTAILSLWIYRRTLFRLKSRALCVWIERKRFRLIWIWASHERWFGCSKHCKADSGKLQVELTSTLSALQSCIKLGFGRGAPAHLRGNSILQISHEISGRMGRSIRRKGLISSIELPGMSASCQVRRECLWAHVPEMPHTADILCFES
jgi:hypothetical protein